MQRRNDSKATVKAVAIRSNAKLFALVSTTAFFALLIFEAVKLA